MLQLINRRIKVQRNISNYKFQRKKLINALFERRYEDFCLSEKDVALLLEKYIDQEKIGKIITNHFRIELFDKFEGELKQLWTKAVRIHRDDFTNKNPIFIKTLFKENPQFHNNFRVYQSNIPMDMRKGKYFNLKFLQMI